MRKRTRGFAVIVYRSFNGGVKPPPPVYETGRRRFLFGQRSPELDGSPLGGGKAMNQICFLLRSLFIFFNNSFFFFLVSSISLEFFLLGKGLSPFLTVRFHVGGVTFLSVSSCFFLIKALYLGFSYMWVGGPPSPSVRQGTPLLFLSGTLLSSQFLSKFLRA